MKATGREIVLHGVVRSATRRLNVCLPGLAAMGAVAFESWSVFGASVLGYAALVVRDLCRPRFWDEVADEVRVACPSLPDRAELSIVGARHFVDRIERARVERDRACTFGALALPPGLVPRLERAADLERRALALVARLEGMGSFLATKSLPVLRADRLRLENAISLAHDDRLRAEYRRALAVLSAEIAVLEEVTVSRDLVAARLERIVGALEQLPNALVRARLGATVDAAGEVRAPMVDLREIIDVVERLDDEERLRARAAPSSPDGAPGSDGATAAARA